jgi:hypothetical protein
VRQADPVIGLSQIRIYSSLPGTLRNVHAGLPPRPDQQCQFVQKGRGTDVDERADSQRRAPDKAKGGHAARDRPGLGLPRGVER